MKKLSQSVANAFFTFTIFSPLYSKILDNILFDSKIIFSFIKS